MPRILREGDNLNGMIVTSGTPHAAPLEAFCTFEVDEDVTTTIDCQVPPLQKLEIGHLIGVTGGALQELDWSKVDWQVYLDGYRLDLETFDQESYVEPELLSSPSPIREVFKQRKTWDIVLIDPTFGMHTLLCSAQTESIAYSWVVNFMINSTSGPLDMVHQPLLNHWASEDARNIREGMERTGPTWDNLKEMMSQRKSI